MIFLNHGHSKYRHYDIVYKKYMQKRGKLIVFYGVNNLGKSTQAKLLVNNLKKNRKRAEYFKYAAYELEPSGSFINGYLREGNPYNLSPREFQILQVLNRTQYQETLIHKLKNGINIIAEDYVGTGIAWGIGDGINPEFLKVLNKHLIKEDLGLLFHGTPFDSGREPKHIHEHNKPLMKRVARIHRELAREYGWRIINANRSREVIAQEIWEIVKKSYK